MHILTGTAYPHGYCILFIQGVDRADNVVSNEKDRTEEKHHVLAALQQNGYPKEFIQRTVKKHNRRKEQPKNTQKKSLSKPKAQAYLTSKESVSSLNEHLISTTSKQHSTPRQPSEVYYQNQRTPYQRKPGTMLYTNETVKIAKSSTLQKQSEH